MVRCIDPNSSIVKDLAKQLKTTPVIAATKIAVWQAKVKNNDAIPTASQLNYIKSPSAGNKILDTSYKAEITNDQLIGLKKRIEILNIKNKKAGIKKTYGVEWTKGSVPTMYSWVLLEFDGELDVEKKIDRAEEQGKAGEAQKLRLMFPKSQQSLFEDIESDYVKPGVPELFESNEEFANQIYEALGFNADLKTFFPKVETVDKFDSDKTGAFFSDINGTLKLPSNFSSLSKETQKEYLQHEYIHLQIWSKFGKNGFYSNKFSSRLFRIGKELFKKYVDNRIFDDDKLEILKTTSRNKDILKDISKSIKNTEEFFTYAFTDFDFANLLKEEGYYDEITNWYKENISSEIFPQITQQQKQKAQQLYSQYLDSLNKPNTNPILQGNQTNIEEIITQLEKDGLLEIDCKGKLKAEDGLATSFTKGGKWKVIKDLKGYPTHKQGGVDLTIGKNGVSIKNGNTQFTAKHGLVIPKN